MKRKFVRLPRTTAPLLAVRGLFFVPLRSPLSAQFQARQRSNRNDSPTGQHKHHHHGFLPTTVGSSTA